MVDHISNNQTSYPVSQDAISHYKKFLGPDATELQTAAFIKGLTHMIGQAITMDNNMAEQGNKALQKVIKENNS